MKELYDEYLETLVLLERANEQLETLIYLAEIHRDTPEWIEIYERIKNLSIHIDDLNQWHNSIHKVIKERQYD